MGRCVFIFVLVEIQIKYKIMQWWLQKYELSFVFIVVYIVLTLAMFIKNRQQRDSLTDMITFLLGVFMKVITSG